MVGCREQQAPNRAIPSPTPSSSSIVKEKELVTETSCVIDADADDTEMAVSDVAAGLTAPSPRQRVSEEGKKPVPSSQHRSSPDRNYSQADSEKLQAVTSSAGDYRCINRIARQPGQPLYRRHSSIAHRGGAMGTGAAAAHTHAHASASPSAEEAAALDVDCDESHDEVLQSGREIPRCEHDNLDSSPDYGRRDSPKGNSRHICKVCHREFPSGRALGGHMRAHGNGDPGTSTNALDWKPDVKQQQQQLISSSPPAHASQLATNAANANGNGTTDAVARPQSLSPESRARARTQREIQSRRAVGARRSNANGKRRGSTTPKSSVEDAAAFNTTIKNIKQEEQQQPDEDDNAASRGGVLQEPSSSTSSDNNSDGAHDDGAATDDAAGNVCDVCREEFENGKQLHTHKKSHEVYALRSNPKRSRRFIDQDYTEVPPSTIATKKVTAPNDKQEERCPYPNCPKRFRSSKALFGHMRCHPDRTWRGIHPPDENGASTSAAGERQHRRKKPRLTLQAPPQVASDSESEPELKQSGKAASEEIESDTESIEAAYMNGDRNQSSTPGWWASGVTGKKRSKRARQAVRSVQAVLHHHGGSSTSNAPPDTALEVEDMNDRETALVMMMLASNPREVVNQTVGSDESNGAVQLSHDPNFGQNGCHVSEAKPEGGGGAAEPSDKEEHNEDEMDEEEEEEEDEPAEAAVVEELEQGAELVTQEAPINFAPDTDMPMEVDEEPEASLSEDGEEEEPGQLEASTSIKHKYQCTTCLRFFRSHQALGGHRASHKKVKGCFARTNVGDGPQQESPDEEMSEELLRSEEQLPTELQDISHSEGDDKDRQLTSYSKDESSTEVVPPAGSSSSTKKSGIGAHKCSECGRCFDSGQALGGHKRCHFDPTKKDAEKEGSSTNNGGKNQRSSNPGGRASSSQGRGRNEGVEGRGHSPRARSDPGLQQQHAQASTAAPAESRSTGGGRAQSGQPLRSIDLNLPASANDDEDEEMAPTAFSATAEESQVDNHEPKASSAEESSSHPDGELGRRGPGGYYALLQVPMDGYGFYCPVCRQQCYSQSALSEHTATHNTMKMEEQHSALYTNYKMTA